MIDSEIEALWTTLRAKLEAKGGRAVAIMATPQHPPDWDCQTLLPGQSKLFALSCFAVGDTKTVAGLTAKLGEWVNDGVITRRFK